MKFQLPHQSPGFVRGKCFVQSCWCVSVEIIQDNTDSFSFWQMIINHIFHAVSKILFSSLLGDFDVAPASQGLQEEKQVTRSFATIFIVITYWLAWLQRQRSSFLTDQLIRHFIKTDHRIMGMIGFGIQVQNIFHTPHEFSTDDGWYAPTLANPRFQFVFFKTSRTVSYEIVSRRVKATIRSASSCSVQRLCPVGGRL